MLYKQSLTLPLGYCAEKAFQAIFKAMLSDLSNEGN